MKNTSVRLTEFFGFKEIRFNFLIPTLKNLFPNCKIIYILRNPYATITSILRRNFWEYGSFKNTFNIWNERSRFGFPALNESIELNKIIELMSYMWVYSNQIAMKDLSNNYFFYEELYKNPFEGFGKIFKYLGMENVFIHPSNIFSPSATTNRTFHGLANRSEKDFYEDLSSKHKDIIKYVVKSSGFDMYDLEEF